MSRLFRHVVIALSGLIVAYQLQVRAADRAEQPNYEKYFTEAALRVDLVHSGTRDEESFSIDEMVVESVWPGTRVHLLDPTGYGKYRFRVFDQATGREIFSKGYCSLFGEWLSTEEAAQGVVRSMPEMARLPFPRAPITLVLETRDSKKGAFVELQRFAIDTTAYDLRRERKFGFEVVHLKNSGKEPAKTLDIVIVPDGYTVSEEKKMLDDARRFADVFTGYAPFDEYQGSIAIHLVKAFSRESGPDEPRKGIFRDTIVDTTFDTFRSPRYLTTSNMKTLSEVASLAHYDTILVMVNTNRYGGGGIFGFYSIFVSDNEYDEYVMIHEFGHGFGGLADEYYTSSTGYDEDNFFLENVEPWEPNITQEKRREKIKWKEFIADDVPIPTPDEEKYDGVVGLFEGAGYKAKGLFRPTRSSKMFHKGGQSFGPVSEAALKRMIQFYTDQEVAP